MLSGTVGVSGGSGVSVAEPTDKPVAADHVPYESSPANAATIVYSPSSGGVHDLLKVP